MMARGFESKDVEYQQAEKERGRVKAHALSPTERDEAGRRRSIELALARSRHELAAAVSPAHRRMLEQAIADLERQLTTNV
jgi:hypothetical protein